MITRAELKLTVEKAQHGESAAFDIILHNDKELRKMATELCRLAKSHIISRRNDFPQRGQANEFFTSELDKIGGWLKELK